MECSDLEPASERACSIESHREMEATLHSLRSLICDLLRENEELRTGLFEAFFERSSVITGADWFCENGKADSINRT